MNLNNHQIINVADPSDDGDVITKRYLESTITYDLIKRDGSNNMQGDLNLDNNKITNVATPTSGQDAVTKRYADSRKPLITIWAQETGHLNAGQYEWSFGSGEYTPAHLGYGMSASGRILSGSIPSVGESDTAGAAAVRIIQNEPALNRYLLSKPAGVNF